MLEILAAGGLMPWLKARIHRPVRESGRGVPDGWQADDGRRIADLVGHGLKRCRYVYGVSEPSGAAHGRVRLQPDLVPARAGHGRDPARGAPAAPLVPFGLAMPQWAAAVAVTPLGLVLMALGRNLAEPWFTLLRQGAASPLAMRCSWEP
ncbi:MAG: hypothetical protein RML12_11015 [Xanthomonadales bacterium]|nr:hypothetical protein [Xanthomonadales bacterium]